MDNPRLINQGTSFSSSQFAGSSSVDTLVQPNTLCSPCQVLLDQSNAVVFLLIGDLTSRFEVFGHHGTIGELISAAIQGCHLCSLLHHDLFALYGYKLSEYGQLSYTLQIKNRLHSRPGVDTRDVRNFKMEVSCEVKVHLKDLTLETEGLLMFLETFASAQKLLAVPPSSLEYQSTASHASFAQTSRWLRECLSNHVTCSQALPQETFVPTRLLYIPSKEQELIVRLRPKEIVQPIPAYFTLSHRWGEVQPLKLTTHNYDAFLQGIPIEQFPKSFHDAAMVVLGLGYNYIWIDSLCIIQDSAQDLAKEMLQMGEIYRDALCNVAAMGAANCLGGCFVARNSLFNRPCIVSEGDSRYLSITHQHRNDEETSKGPTLTGDTAAPLQQRSWVVQERALSPRTIYYGSNMIFWECLEGAASEVQPQLGKHASICYREPSKGDPRIKMQKWSSSVKKSLADLLSQKEIDDDWYSRWVNIVVAFTGCQMTYKKDKWVALSGLARVVEQRWGLHVLCGMWREYLAAELVWAAVEPGIRLENEFPSWSWLSVDAQLSAAPLTQFQRIPFFSGGQSEAKITSTQTGAGWRLNIRAPIRKCQWSKEYEENPNPRTKYHIPLNHTGLSYLCEWYPDTEPDPNTEVWMVLIIKDPSPPRNARGLVMVPKTDDSDLWIRVGSFYLCYIDPVEVGDWRIKTVQLC